LISSVLPDDFPPSKAILSDTNSIELLKKAFAVAESKIGIPQILEAENMLNNVHDEKDVLLYLSEMRLKMDSFNKEKVYQFSVL
jgi:hypothetical protein